MDDRAAGATNNGAGSHSPASAEPPSSSRRRAAAQKRKSTSISNFLPVSFTPSKRASREKSGSLMYPSSYHNGRLTRAAKQTPGNGLSSSDSTPVALKLEENEGAVASDSSDYERKMEELEMAMDAEFEAIRSRDSNSHVVPSHCGWFSWTKIHTIEERSLPSFFDGKSETRTPDSYLKIRNWIVKRFHSDPNVMIEEKDLSELESEDAEAKKEIHEFLEYWGLINFHPFPKLSSIDESKEETEAPVPNNLIDSLYHFSVIPPTPAVAPRKCDPPPHSSSPKLLIESAMAEEVAKAEGPSVEYHCNSCAADCSRKRYHCQKQADYDLCAECFTNGKFDSDMSSSDFILMEPPEAQGVSGGNWTDQETLLLLEALEMFEDNWSEIAEHVATKTKTQCLLHFLQMPIEDSFVENDDDAHEPSKPEEELDVKGDEGIKALTEAFDAIGYSPVDSRLCLSDVANPVMALVGFLARFVDGDMATASARCSLKSLACESPGIHLATRHCCLLDDPPDELSENCEAVDIKEEDPKNSENPTSSSKEQDPNETKSQTNEETKAQTIEEMKTPMNDAPSDNDAGAKEETNGETTEDKAGDSKSNDKAKSAAMAALSAAVVKARIFASHEEEVIRQLSAFVVERQVRKLELKMSYFNEMESMVMRVREQIERSKQKLGHERAQIIANRLGLQSSSSKPQAPSPQGHRVPAHVPVNVPRPLFGPNSFRPPIPRPMGGLNPGAGPFARPHNTR